MKSAIKIPLGSLLAVAAIGLAACGGSNDQTQPKTAANETTTGAPVNVGSTATPTPETTPPPSTQPNAAPQATPGAGEPPSTTPGLTAGSTPPAMQTVQPESSTSSSSSPTTITLTDAQIASIIDTVDSTSVEQAREAARKAKNQRVRELAHDDLTKYAADRSRLAALDSHASIAPERGPMTEKLESSGEQAGANLRSASGADFDKAYVDARIAAQGDLLDLIDGKLLVQVKNAELKQHLMDLRTVVSHNLKLAREVQATLK